MNASIDRAIARIQRLRDLTGIDEALDRAATDDVIPNVQRYPPERPNQKYVRTFRLRDAWTKRGPEYIGRGWRITVLNPTDYAPPVIGVKQGRLFQGRWRTIRTMRDDVRPLIRARLAAALRRLARGR